MAEKGLVGILAALYFFQLLCSIMPVNQHERLWLGSLFATKPLEGINECWNESVQKLYDLDTEYWIRILKTRKLIIVNKVDLSKRCFILLIMKSLFISSDARESMC